MTQNNEVTTLSEKKVCVGDITLGKLNEKLSYYVYKEKDVKHDIKRLNELISIAWYEEWDVSKFRDEVKKIFGKELTGGIQDD